MLLRQLKITGLGELPITHGHLKARKRQSISCVLCIKVIEVTTLLFYYIFMKQLVLAFCIIQEMNLHYTTKI